MRAVSLSALENLHGKINHQSIAEFPTSANNQGSLDRQYLHLCHWLVRSGWTYDKGAAISATVL